MAGEPEPTTTITDVAVLRALAHPARIALLDHLASAGPSTATECAGVVTLSPSATSYHLRALAKVGMVEEAPSRGDGRERLWRSTVASYRVDSAPPDAAPELRAATRELLDTFIAWEETRVRRYVATIDTEPQEWNDVAIFNDSTLLVTAEELTKINQEVLAVLRPYVKRTRENPPPGARTVSALLRAFPTDSPLHQ
jgi:DNA-binding transcriptional ArsR family regulator